MMILNKLIAWVLNKIEARKNIITVAENEDLYSLVESKMKAMENEAELSKIKSLEKIVLRLTNEIHNLNEENKTQRELLLHLSTNTEEVLNLLSGGFQDGEQYSDEEGSEEEVVWNDTNPSKKANFN